MKSRLVLILFILVFCYSCKDEAEIPDHGLYRLTTNNPVIENGGVIFSATIDVEGVDLVEERGFIVSRNYADYDGSLYETIVENHAIPLDGDFRLRLEGDWDPTISSSVYAYVKTKKYNYKGELIEFTPNGSTEPKIHSVTLEAVGKSGTLTIKGENFSRIWYRNRVYLGELECELLEFSPTELVANCYLSLFGDYDVTVSVAGMETKFPNAFYIPPPKILSVSPDNISTWEEIVIMLEDFSKENEIIVNIGEGSASIIEKEDNYIRVLCPVIEEGKDLSVTIYFPEQKFWTSGYNVTAPQNWTSMNVRSSSSGIQYIISENEAYSITREMGLCQFNKKKYEWEPLSQCTHNVTPITIFGKGKYIYVAAYEILDDEPVPSLFIYNLANDSWQKNQTLIPMMIDQGALGVWVNDDYYLTTRHPLHYNYMLVKYSPQTDAWTIVNENLGEYYFELVTAESKVYAYFISSCELYVFDLEQQKLGELVYTLPSYLFEINYVRCEMRHNNDYIYLGAGLYHPMCIFSFNLVNMEFKALGFPEARFYELDFILPFQEALYIGCKDQNSYVYKYIGKE